MVEFERPSTRLKLDELETQLVEKQAKFEQVQEQNAEYLQQINQMLHEKFGEHRQYDQLHSQNTALTLQVEELQETYQRLQLSADEKKEEKSALVEKSTQNTIVEEPAPKPTREAQITAPPHSLSSNVCAKLWKLESKIIPNCQLLQYYEIQRDFFLIMAGLEIEDWMSHAQF